MSTAIARNLMAEMKLAGMLAAFDKTVTDATRDQLGYSEFLDVLLQAEADYRGERVAQRRLKAAKLPARVSLDDYEPGGREFESLRARHPIKYLLRIAALNAANVAKT